MQRPTMIYQIKRTYITLLGDEATLEGDRRNDYVEAQTARDAAEEFVRAKGTLLIGEVASLPGDAAMATCKLKGATYVIRVTPISSEDSAAGKSGSFANLSRRSTDRKERSD